jgi:LysM repeat protein
MSKINNLQPKTVDNSFLPIGTTAAKTANANPNAKQANAAINQLTSRFAEMQKVQTQPQEVPKEIAVDFNRDFGGKPTKNITEADTLKVFYTKLAEQSKLSEESKTEFVNEMMNRKPEDLYLTHEGRKHQGTEFADHKKSGSLTINVSESEINRLKELQSKDIETNKQNDQKADELINKYLDKNSWSWDEDGSWFDNKRDYPLDEASLGKELANENPSVIEKVLSRLPNPEDVGQVNKAMSESMSEEQKIKLGQTEKGQKILQNINNQRAEQQPKTEPKQTVANEIDLAKSTQAEIENDPRFKPSLENPRWNEYDETIKSEVEFYNNKFKDTPNFKPLDWRAVKAMLWTENLGGPTPNNAQGEWEKRPLQIGVPGDPGLGVIQNGRENSDLVTTSETRSELLKDSNGKNNIRAGVAYLYTRTLESGIREVIDDSNIQTYKIQKGDSIDTIAKNLGTTRDNILKNSGLTINGKLSLGQEIKYQKAHQERYVSGWKDWKSTVRGYNGNATWGTDAKGNQVKIGVGDPDYMPKVSRAYQIILSREQK